MTGVKLNLWLGDPDGEGLWLRMGRKRHELGGADMDLGPLEGFAPAAVLT